MICPDDFHQYLSTRIRDAELLPWIPCPAEVCGVPCDAQNITEDGRLTHSELLSFIITMKIILHVFNVNKEVFFKWVHQKNKKSYVKYAMLNKQLRKVLMEILT
jgi:hypothetical protein